MITVCIQFGSQHECGRRDWYKDFGSFKLCGSGEYPRKVLTAGMKARGEEIE